MIRNAKKLEKLQAKVDELNRRIKEDMQLKAKYEKEIDSIQTAEISAFVKSNKIVINDEFMKKLMITEKLFKGGYSAEDIEKLFNLGESSKTTDTTAKMEEKYDKK